MHCFNNVLDLIVRLDSPERLPTASPPTSSQHNVRGDAVYPPSCGYVFRYPRNASNDFTTPLTFSYPASAPTTQLPQHLGSRHSSQLALGLAAILPHHDGQLPRCFCSACQTLATLMMNHYHNASNSWLTDSESLLFIHPQAQHTWKHDIRQLSTAMKDHIPPQPDTVQGRHFGL